MKKLMLFAVLALSVSSVFAAERFLGTVILADRDFGDAIRVNSCEGPRDQRLRSLTLHVRHDGLDLRDVLVRMEDPTGRPGVLRSVPVRRGIYPVGARIYVDLTGPMGYARCVEAIQILGDSVGGGDEYGRPGPYRPGPIIIGPRGPRRGPHTPGGIIIRRPGPGMGHRQPTVVDVYGDILTPYGY